MLQDVDSSQQAVIALEPLTPPVLVEVATTLVISVTLTTSLWIGLRSRVPQIERGRLALATGYVLAATSLLINIASIAYSIWSLAEVEWNIRNLAWRALVPVLRLSSWAFAFAVAGALAATVAAMFRSSKGVAFRVLLATGVLACTSLIFSRVHDAAQSALDLMEPFEMIDELRRVQDTYHSETGMFANVSTAIAANAETNHQALYPYRSEEPGMAWTAWGMPCPPSACNPRTPWSSLPVHVNGRVRFGYSMVAGRAGEVPNATIIMRGQTVEWPIPAEEWYVITAVGDPEGTGNFTTVLASSFRPEVLIDNGRRDAR